MVESNILDPQGLVDRWYLRAGPKDLSNHAKWCLQDPELFSGATHYSYIQCVDDAKLRCLGVPVFQHSHADITESQKVGRFFTI